MAEPLEGGGVQPYSKAERLLNLLMALRGTRIGLDREQIRTVVRGYSPRGLHGGLRADVRARQGRAARHGRPGRHPHRCVGRRHRLPDRGRLDVAAAGPQPRRAGAARAGCPRVAARRPGAGGTQRPAQGRGPARDALDRAGVGSDRRAVPGLPGAARPDRGLQHAHGRHVRLPQGPGRARRAAPRPAVGDCLVAGALVPGGLRHRPRRCPGLPGLPDRGPGAHRPCRPALRGARGIRCGRCDRTVRSQRRGRARPRPGARRRRGAEAERRAPRPGRAGGRPGLAAGRGPGLGDLLCSRLRDRGPCPGPARGRRRGRRAARGPAGCAVHARPQGRSRTHGGCPARRSGHGAVRPPARPRPVAGGEQRSPGRGRRRPLRDHGGAAAGRPRVGHHLGGRRLDPVRHPVLGGRRAGSRSSTPWTSTRP